MQQLQLSIPEPCHQNWHDMNPTQQGRFCNACAKEVIDFSTMSDSEVLGYFSSIKNEKVCGRAYPDQLDRAITMPKEIKKAKFWYWNYAAMFFLFFSKMTMKAQAQGQVITVPAKIDVSTELQGQLGGFIITKSMAFTGKITDKDDNPIPFASIKIKGANTGVSASDNGEFSITGVTKNTILEVSAVGFKTIDISPAAISPAHSIILEKAANTTLDTVKLVSYGTIKKGRIMIGAVSSVQVKNVSIIDTIKSFLVKPIFFKSDEINIYPNPVQRGSLFTIALKLKQAGKYNIQIVDAAGRTVLQKQIYVAAKEFIDKVQTDSRWSGGTYFVRVVDNNSKLISTNNLILQ
jgi:CarboxypepD_reg-like domain/Secretion system C-terminal sorting domain